MTSTPSLTVSRISRPYGFLPEPLPDAQQRLEALEESLQDDLEVVSYPARTWNYSVDAEVLEVAIIGGGHTGKSAAFGLRRHGITGVCIFDRHPPGLEGPWRTYARNATLRTPKVVTGGLDWGIPNLHFRRWCEARYGKDYWLSIDYIPRLLWAEYLDWYGQVLDLPIQNQASIADITWDTDRQHFRLESPDRTYQARFVILATGMESAGGRAVPPIVPASLPPHVYCHTMDEIDFNALKHKRISIIGCGASAFDNAIAALHAGAAQVDILFRRKHIPNLNRIRWSEWNGYHRHYIDLPDHLKWFYSLEEARLGQLPPPHTYAEALRYENLALHADAPLQQLQFVNGEIIGQYGDRTFHHDYLICGTGFTTNLDQQEELRSLAPHIARWHHHYQPPVGEENADLANYPYLGKHLELTPLDTEHDYLRKCYYLSSGAALLSGFRANLSGLQFALPRIAYDIGKQLFLEHQEEIKQSFMQYDRVEFTD